MPNGRTATPMPSRSMHELANIAVTRGYQLRRRERVRNMLVIALIVAIAGATIPFVLPSTRDVREGLVDEPERRRRATQAEERRDEQERARAQGGRRVGVAPLPTAVAGVIPTPGPNEEVPVAKTDTIAFVRDDVRPAIWLMDGDGTGEKALTHSSSEARDPDWSPDGGKIVYATGDSLVVHNLDDGTLETINDSPNAREFEPSFSPDGRRIAYSARAVTSSGDGQADVYVMDADGDGVRRLTRTSDASETGPAWAPDGRTIVFARSGGSVDPGLFTMRADGSDVHRLTDGLDLEPSWSPSGDKIVFTHYDAVTPGPSDLYVMDADGSDQRNLTNTVELFEYTADWSPGGKTIAFTRDDDGRETPYDPVVTGTGAWVSGESVGPRSAIFVMNADGSGALALTKYTDVDTSPTYRPR